MTKEYRYTVPFNCADSFEKEVANYIGAAHHEEVRRLACSGYVFLLWKKATNLTFKVPFDLSGCINMIDRKHRLNITLRFTNPDKYENRSSIHNMFQDISGLGIGTERSVFIRKLILNGFIYENLSSGGNNKFLPDLSASSISAGSKEQHHQKSKDSSKVKSHLGGLM